MDNKKIAHHCNILTFSLFASTRALYVRDLSHFQQNFKIFYEIIFMQFIGFYRELYFNILQSLSDFYCVAKSYAIS